MSDDESPHEPVVIPAEQLTPDALHGVIEAFVLREGTDYGTEPVSLAQKVTAVRQQLDRGEAVIVFDPQTESVDILSAQQWRERRG